MRRRRAATMAVPVALVAAAAATTLLRSQVGPVVRTVPLGQGQYASATAVDAATGHVYVTIYDPAQGKTWVQVLDAAGASRVAFASAPNAPAPLVVPAGTGRLLLIRPSPDGQTTRVSVLDAARGTTLRTTAVPLFPSFDGTGAASGGVVTIASPGDQNCTGAGSGPPTCTLSGSGVALLDAATGRPRRVFRVPGRAWAAALDARAAHVLIASATGPVLRQTSLTVSVFDATTGRLLRRIALAVANADIERMVVDAATGRAFLFLGIGIPPSTFGSRLYVLDTRSAATVRALAWGGGAGNVAVDERAGRVFVTDTGPVRLFRKMVSGGGGMGMFLPVGPGALHTLDARTGAPLRTTTLGIAPWAIAVDERRGRVYVANGGSHDGYGTMGSTPIDIPAPTSGPGGVSVVDVATGRILRTVPLGTRPASIALDERDGRLFVGDMGDPAPKPAPDSWGWLPAPVRQRLPFLPRHAPAARSVPGGVIVLDTSRL